jgi:hypothetical protein
MHCLVGRCCLKQLDTASNLTLIAIAKLNIHIIFGQLDLWQEHQNFCKPFFDPFFRQHSPVPILTGFFKRQ